MSYNDNTSYLDHSHLTPADFTAFEQILAARRDSRPYLDSDWDLILTSHSHTGRTWESTHAIFRPGGAFGTADEVYVRVYFDENGRALPDRPRHPASAQPLTSDLAEQLPGWSVQPCPVSPGRDLAELRHQTWGWGTPPWNIASVPHAALALTGPQGEKLLAVQVSEDAPLLVGAVIPDGFAYTIGAVRPPAPVAFTAGTTPATVASEITKNLAPRYQQAVWHERTGFVTYALANIQDLTTAWIPDPDSPWSYHGEIGSFESEAARNRAAWRGIETLINHGPHVTAGIRAAATIEDHLDPVIGPDLRRLYVTEDALTRLHEIRDGWQAATASIVGTHPEADRLRHRAKDLRNQEAWAHAVRAADGPLPALAAHVTPRIGSPVPDREQQVKAALTRTGRLQGQSAPAPAPPVPPAPAAHRPTR
ncbi:hypothetical protein AB0F92_12810 [Kitasatospora aureofaciens]|uniref:hypothetical protein n=1 Tax=Kitasatospora aureofaciens TaxID=1894 RepID=UPI0033F6AC2B